MAAATQVQIVRWAGVDAGEKVLRFDDDYLADAGVGALPEWARPRILRHLYGVLELRVGMVLVNRMNVDEVTELERLMEDGAGALAWLEANHPGHREIVREEFERLRDELRRNGPRLLAHAGLDGGLA